MPTALRVRRKATRAAPASRATPPSRVATPVGEWAAEGGKEGRAAVGQRAVAATNLGSGPSRWLIHPSPSPVAGVQRGLYLGLGLTGLAEAGHEAAALAHAALAHAHAALALAHAALAHAHAGAAGGRWAPSSRLRCATQPGRGDKEEKPTHQTVGASSNAWQSTNPNPSDRCLARQSAGVASREASEWQAPFELTWTAARM